MDRRDLLATCGAALVGLTGCTGEQPGSGDTTSPTDTTTTTTPSVSLTVERTRVLPSLVALTTPDSVDVVGDQGERYVLVTADATDAGDPPARDDFTLSVGGTDHGPQTDVGYGQSLAYFHGVSEEPVYGADGPSGDLPFVVDPLTEASEVTLAWPGGETTLEGAGAALARATPSFSVESFTATAEAGTATLSVTVRNRGDVRGWFVGAVNVRGPSVAVAPVTGVAVEVAPGETATWTHEEDPIAGGEGEAEFTLRTTDGDHEATATFGESG